MRCVAPGHPRSPDRLGVAVDVDVILGRHEQQHRAGNASTGGRVGFFMLAIDAKPRAVVLAHAVDNGGVAQGPQTSACSSAPSRRSSSDSLVAASSTTPDSIDRACFPE